MARAGGRQEVLGRLVELCQRYLPGQQLYLSTVRPRERADVVSDNNDPVAPVVRKVSDASRRTPDS